MDADVQLRHFQHISICNEKIIHRCTIGYWTDWMGKHISGKVFTIDEDSPWEEFPNQKSCLSFRRFNVIFGWNQHFCDANVLQIAPLENEVFRKIFGSSSMVLSIEWFYCWRTFSKSIFWLEKRDWKNFHCNLRLLLGIWWWWRCWYTTKHENINDETNMIFWLSAVLTMQTSNK